MASETLFEFVVCIRNDGYPAALETRKIYRVVADPAASRRGFLRVVDESGEDYLYARDQCLPIELSEPMKDALKLAG